MKRPAPLSILALALAFCGGVAVDSIAFAEKADDSPHAAIEQFGRVLVQIENRYVDPVDRAKLVDGAIKGMVAELDPHSEYFPATEYGDFTSETEGKFGGVGVEVDASGDYLVVITAFEGEPADVAGVKPGDEIVEIDGKDAKNVGLDKSLHLMRGDVGTKVEIVVRRPSESGKLYRMTLTRKEIHVPSVDWDVLQGGVVYLRIRQFVGSTHDQLVDAIGKAKAKAGKVGGVVLDLRRNPGGLVDQAVAVADEFLDKGIIYSMRGQGGKTLEEEKASSGGALVSAPMAVLVDEGSASAAELVAGALQDPKRAVVVGETTFGKGSVQSIIDLPGGAGLKLTTARYYTPSGRSIQATGIVPDVVVESTRVVEPKAPAPKEKDYANALPAEATSPAASTSASTTTKDAPPPNVNADAGPPSPAAIALLRKPDPEKDFQLKMALQIVTGVLAKK